MKLYHTLLILFILICYEGKSQSHKSTPTPYNPFEKYAQRRHIIANWQINQLADSGVLIVRLQSHKKIIDHYLKNNQPQKAREWQQIAYLQNKYIVSAFAKYYNFSKIYFMYDYSSDSLLKNYRKGIFLDTNLNRNPDIEMKEKFYLLAERSEIIESSIGLVPDSIAPHISETGATIKHVAIVIKNKYGHQLKRPFPFYVKGNNLKKYKEYVIKLNKNLHQFKEKNPRIQYPIDVKPYLY